MMKSTQKPHFITVGYENQVLGYLMIRIMSTGCKKELEFRIANLTEGPSCFVLSHFLVIIPWADRRNAMRSGRAM